MQNQLRNIKKDIIFNSSNLHCSSIAVGWWSSVSSQRHLSSQRRTELNTRYFPNIIEHKDHLTSHYTHSHLSCVINYLRHTLQLNITNITFFFYKEKRVNNRRCFARQLHCPNPRARAP